MISDFSLPTTRMIMLTSALVECKSKICGGILSDTRMFPPDQTYEDASDQRAVRLAEVN